MTSPRSAHTGPIGDDGKLRTLVRRSRQPVGMFRAVDGEILEVSDALVAMFGASRQDMLGRVVLDFVVDEAAARARTALMTAGDLHGYHVLDHGYRRLDGSKFTVDTSVNSLGADASDHSAVAVLIPARNALARMAVPADPTTAIVLGTVDDDLRVDRIGADVEHLLGVEPTEVVGEPIDTLVEPADLPALLIGVARGRRSPAGATVGVRLRAVNGASRQCQMLVTRLADDAEDSLAFAFAITEPGRGRDVERTWELELALQRIAREIEATGALAGSWGAAATRRLPLLAGLSSRELEIVTRLITGDRVPMIARRLFLSESTVRNHLTSVYRKLGVRSQQQLISLVRTDQGSASSGGFA